ncbi:hypothetical protein [Tropicibacter sp. Alg240-R139]|uniref:hypothetical protein n=1 Tax=Tropicibacter sp. Alg240-R139 TaxID=2305991 RepID=UPI001F078AA7|nr:hypothetical protein [Tropicibacter sp. Alg240-R139]
MIPARSLIITALLVQALPVAADDGGVTRAFEIPTHRALMSIRTDAELSAFETDGCSGGLSYSWRVVARSFPDFAEAHDQIPPWENCCVIHDRAYHNAGGAETAEDSYDARLTADKALESCVKRTGALRVEDVAAHYEVGTDAVATAYEAIAEAMYLAVRFGGAPCSGLPWRWGFGYPGCTVLDAISPARE